MTFRINGGEKGGHKLKLIAQTAAVTKTNADFPNNPVTAAMLMTTLVPGKWKSVTLSLKDLGVMGKANFIGFWWQEAAGKKDSTPYYVDDVRLLRPSDPAPQE